MLYIITLSLKTLFDLSPQRIKIYWSSKLAHRDVLLHCLESVYPRMAKNAVCMLMDCYDPAENPKGLDINRGVKLAFDIFFKEETEKIVALFGEMYNHAYFRKV